jgi:DNA-binding transcriptional regulator LsrR (DeoR family)/transcriptional regulator with XRE-family HTH domain
VSPNQPSTSPPSIARRFQTNLKALRSARGLTIQQIADELSRAIGGEVQPITVRRWFAETRPTVPNLEHLVGLARVFNSSPNELLGDQDDLLRTAPHPIAYCGRPLIRLVRRPRPGEANGVEIARRLCQEEPVDRICQDLKIDEGGMESQLRHAAYGDLFEVVEPITTDANTAQRLQDKFQLRVCQVAAIDSMQFGILQTVILGALGAQVVKERQKVAPQAVGLAGGLTCARLVMSLVQSLATSDGLRLMPIAVQGSLGDYTAMNANALVGMFGYLMGRSGPEDVTIPHYLSNAELRDTPHHPTRVQLDDIVRQVSIAFLGLGGNVRWFFNGIFRNPNPVPEGASIAVTGAELSAAGCKGDILYNFVDDNGVMDTLKPVCDQLVCSIGLKGLRELASVRRVPVVAIVADEYKWPVVRLALREGYINSLITTTAVARQLLDNAPARS